MNQKQERDRIIVAQIVRIHIAGETLSPGRIIVRPNECLPCPEAFGPCACPRCTAEREAPHPPQANR